MTLEQSRNVNIQANPNFESKRPISSKYVLQSDMQNKNSLFVEDSKPTTNSGPGQKNGRFGHMQTIIYEDIFSHDWRLIFFSFLGKLLPQNTLLRLRKLLLRLSGLAFGKGTVFMDVPVFSVHEKAISSLSFGEGCFVNVGCLFDLSAEINIHDNVYFGHRVMLITSNHDFSNPHQRGGPLTGLPILIEKGAWIGAGATILPGVVVGSGSVVAAGSIVSKNVLPNTVVGGVPAKLIRELD